MAGLVRDNRGVILIFVLITLAVAPLVTFGFIRLASTSLQVASDDEDSLLARYASDSGVVDVVSDLLQGTDALDGYAVPTPTVNSLPVTVAVNAPWARYRAHGALPVRRSWGRLRAKSVDSQTHYFIRLDSVSSGSSIRVNWAFTPTTERWKLKLYQGTGPPGAPAATVIASDDFESGDFSGGTGDWVSASWTTAGDASVVSSASPFEGTFHVRLRRGNGHMERDVDLSGKTNVRLQFWAKASSFETGETATCSVDDGGGLTVVRLWEDGEDDDVYRFEDIDLSSFTMSATFLIVCDANMSGAGDQFFIDALEVVSQAFPTPIAEASDTEGPGELFAPASLVTSGGAYTIDFFNDSGVSLVSGSFSTGGASTDTWIYATAFKDYLISSTADGTNIVAFARQIPGPTNPVTRQSVFIESWKDP